VTYSATQKTIRLSLLTLLTFTAGSVTARADVVQSTVILPPPTGSYDFSGFACIAALDRCLENGSVSDFTNEVSTQIGSNEQVTLDALYTGGVYTDNSGVPGVFLGTLNLTGTATFVYTGRNVSVQPLGTFPTQVTSFDFSGIFNGKTFAVEQNPGVPSTGTTTINETSMSPVEYTVTSDITLNAEYNYNGTGYTPAPPRTGSLTSVPEPGFGALAASILTGLLAAASRRRIR
jgi:hypothetical protein